MEHWAETGAESSLSGTLPVFGLAFRRMERKETIM